MIKVLIIEHQQLMREGLKALVSKSDDMEVVGLAGDVKTGEEKIDQSRPDVVLLDLDHERLFAIEEAVKIKERYPQIRIILLASEIEETLVFKGLGIGVEGFLMKNLDTDYLIRCIRDAYNNQIIISGEVAQLIAKNLSYMSYEKKDILRFKLQGKNTYLSNREHDVAYLLMKGKGNKEMSEALNLTEGTIKNYISTIYSKLKLHRRQDVEDYLRGFFKE